MRKCLLIAAAAIGTAAVLFTTGFARAEEHASGEAGYLKSATYYSDDWVINFWNSESKHMEEELAQIREDGFNNIILAVPWREFQPGISPCTYNDYAWEKLDRVMNAASAQNLSVMLRVGYTWDYAGRDNVLERYKKLMYDVSAQKAWMEYVGRLYERASAHENFCGGFLTWEDFWNFTDSSADLGNTVEGRRLAQASGYTDYARANYSLEELSKMYGHSIRSYEELYFPDQSSYARRVFYEFYDQFLNDMLVMSQTVFPGLSMEVRLDADPVNRQDGIKEGFMHTSTYPCGSAAYTRAMYSVPMGFENKNERVSAAEALEKAPVFFNRLRVYSGGKPAYIDQLLFTDNTIGYEHNAQLQDDQKALYLEGLAPILKNMTMGYGIWTYRDYGDNKLFNAQFALGSEGWMLSGGSYLTEWEGSKALLLLEGGSVSQSIGNRMTGAIGENAFVRFKAESEDSSRITIKLGGRVRTVEVQGSRTVEVQFRGCRVGDLSISVSGGAPVYVDDIQVYTFVTQGELYNLDGTEGACIEALRRMNQNL